MLWFEGNTDYRFAFSVSLSAYWHSSVARLLAVDRLAGIKKSLGVRSALSLQDADVNVGSAG